MIFKNIDFHNVDEMTKNDDGSYTLHRTPVSLEKELTAHNGDKYNRSNVGVELRFVMKSDVVKLRFKAAEDSKIVSTTIFVGDLYHSATEYITAEGSEIVLEKEKLDPAKCNSKAYGYFEPAFDSSVIRISLQAGWVHFIDVEGEVAPPTPDLLPKRKMLAYGSSITSASGAIRFENGYSARVGEAFGCDATIKGYPGSCCMQKEMADYLAKQEFDFAVLELGVNILNVGPEEFGRRLTYLLDKVCNSHKDKRFFLISPFFMWDDYGVEKPSVLFRREFTRVLNELKLQNAVYIDGLTLFGNPQHLNTDSVHPDPRGHEIIAERLVKIMKDYI